ncbi:MAG TPA: glycosyl hydrolase family 28-related protein [Bryobacteraceae bacterium]|nr:glycosyl hydrolase family 28-related protein [Bryobacteraceae bacterium]
MTRRTYFGLLASGAAPLALAAAPAHGAVSVTGLGAKGDGKTDDTVAIQRAMDTAAKTGGTVFLPPAKYLVAGSLRVPPGVALEGALDAPQWSEPLTGSVILATGGRDREDGPSLFEMGTSSMVRALTVYYPEQKVTDIRPYSWTFHLQGNDNTVENVTLINSYNGIRLGPENNCRHRIRSVTGCVLRRGLLVNNTTDIGRVENVQWHCHWWISKQVGGEWKPVHEFMWKNLEAFLFGRTDWEYVTNTFVYPVNIGYKFIRTQQGACNGQFSGIGADEAQRCVSVEQIQRMGLLITNGEFVCMHGDERVEVVVEKTCTGSVRLVNCAFWGPARKCVESHSSGFVSLSDCYLEISGKSSTRQIPGVSLIEADNGRLQIRGCTFGSHEPAIVLKPGLRHAILSENNGENGVQIVNQIGDRAVIVNNEPYPAAT